MKLGEISRLAHGQFAFGQPFQGHLFVSGLFEAPHDDRVQFWKFLCGIQNGRRSQP